MNRPESWFLFLFDRLNANFTPTTTWITLWGILIVRGLADQIKSAKLNFVLHIWYQLSQHRESSIIWHTGNSHYVVQHLFSPTSEKFCLCSPHVGTAEHWADRKLQLFRNIWPKATKFINLRMWQKKAEQREKRQTKSVWEVTGNTSHYKSLQVTKEKK